MNEVQCTYCHHHCLIKEGETGFCRVRTNRNGENTDGSYGLFTSLAYDPVEKKPLYHFYPGSMILSAGSFGCNLRCPFCQNHTISMADESNVRTGRFSVEELVSEILKYRENLGCAFTYNEPFLNFEYIIETAERIHAYGKKIVLVTNGCFSEEVLNRFKGNVDAMNIDLKGDREYYRELSGDYDMVRKTIADASAFCHVEVTTLVIPGKNDSVQFIREQAKWLSEVDPEMVYHLSRYFPCYKSTIPATDLSVLYELKEAAQEYLPHVYLGNI